LKERSMVVDDGAATRAMAAMADRDVAEYRPEMRGHTRVLNALRETQIEHGRTLAQHGRALGGLRETQVEHGRTLAEHGRALIEHGKALNQCIRILDQHTRTLDDHGQALVTLTAGQAAIMQHLGIPGRGNDERTGD
jgi:ribonuclease PH